jgi:hypothetical protein
MSVSWNDRAAHNYAQPQVIQFGLQDLALQLSLPSSQFFSPLNHWPLASFHKQTKKKKKENHGL